MSPTSLPLPTISEPTQTATPFSSPTPRSPIYSTVHPAPNSISMELFGNFHAMGVTVALPTDNDPDKNALAFLEYRNDDGEFQAGFPLTRINDTHFVGSIFWLQPDNNYEVKITFLDPQSPLDCAVIQGTSNTRAEPVIPESSQVFFVSPDGDGQICTLEQPCILTTALAKSGADTSIVLRGGIYYQGNINITKGGESGKPLIIKSYPDEEVMFDGSEPEDLQWELSSDGIYTARITDTETNLVFAGDVRLYPYRNIEDLKNFRWNLPGYFLQGNTVYIHLNNNADPNGEPIFVSRYPHALWIGGGYTYLLNISFRHYSENRFQQGAVHLASSDNLIQGNMFINTHRGIAVEANSNRNLIQANTFSDAIFDWQWDAAYVATRERTTDPTHLVTNQGIRFKEGEPIARGNVIRRNVFHDTFDGFHTCPNQERSNFTNETDVYENLVYRNSDDGMETDGYCSNVRIWGNTFHDVLAGISLAPARVGPVYSIRNLTYNTGVTKHPPFGDTPPCCGNSIKFETSESSGFMYLFHNTAVSSTGSPGIRIAGDGRWSLVYARNNLWVGQKREALKHDMSLQPLDLDYDALVSVNSSKLVYWNGTYYSTLQSFISATNLEIHGISEIALPFNDPPNNIYTLSPTSLLIDSGVYIPGINDGYHGIAPDIGAFEAGD